MNPKSVTKLRRHSTTTYLDKVLANFDPLLTPLEWTKIDVIHSGAVGGKTGKTGKTSVLPRFSKIEGGAPQWWSYLARAR